MAAITAANVTLVKSFNAFDRGQLLETCREVIITLTAQGGTAADIPASALGFSYLTNVEFVGFVDNGAVKRFTYVWLEYATTANATGLSVGDPTQATDANRGIIANLTGTLRVRVYGKPSN